MPKKYRMKIACSSFRWVKEGFRSRPSDNSFASSLLVKNHGHGCWFSWSSSQSFSTCIQNVCPQLLFAKKILLMFCFTTSGLFFLCPLGKIIFFSPRLLSIEIDVNIRGLWGDHTGKKHSRGCPHYFLCISLCDFVTWPQGVRSWKEGKRSPQTWRNNWNEGWVNVSI